VAVEVIGRVGEAIDIGGVCGGDVVANDGKISGICTRGFARGDAEKVGCGGLGVWDCNETPCSITGVEKWNAIFEEFGRDAICRVIVSSAENKAGKILSHEAAGGTGLAGSVGSAVGVGPSLGHLILHTDHHEENHGKNRSGGHELDEGERRRRAAWG